MQHEITKRGKLLDENGKLTEPGWARDLLLEYDRNAIKARKLRIKEWDYYIVINDSYAVALTIADNSYMGLVSATLLDFEAAKEHTESAMELFTKGRYKLPSTSHSGVTEFHNKRVDMKFEKTTGRRNISCQFREFYQGKDLEVDIVLQQPDMDTMVIATPWSEDEKAFYYNQKINCMRASGKATFDGRDYIFSPETDFGTLDWGRGVWTYKNTWFWGSGNGIVNDKPFGFNIGYGFGNTAAASENIIQYDGKANKLDQITFNIPPDSYMKPWTFSSNDGRFEMDFVPTIDRAAKTNALIFSTDQHQVFGKMNGKAVLDDGTVLEIKDLRCFAEHVTNRY